jgi:DNA-binding MarR family transcriptional regulator
MSCILKNMLMALALHLHDQMSLSAKREIGRSLTDASALVLVWNNGPIPIHLFSATIGMSHPAAVQQIDRLCADGLLERSVGEDRRRRLVALTAKGRQRVGAFLKARAAVAHRVLANVGGVDHAVLERVVAQILSASAIDRPTVDHLCRCCDERACPPHICPAERRVSGISSPLTRAW